MGAWLIRAGRHGQDEALALERGLALIGFYEVPDLRGAASHSDVRAIVEATYPDSTVAKVSNFTGQLYSFGFRMKQGDIVALPLKSQPHIALGTIRGDYVYRTDLGQVHHVRPVDWVRIDAPRDIFGQDLLYTLGAAMTVCAINRPNAQERLRSIMAGGADPELGGGRIDRNDDPGENGRDVPAESVDIEQLARDQIRSYIGGLFKEHDLARLLDAVLQAEGYSTLVSPPGPDGGVDILARKGSLGLEGPRLCVQVKSSATPSDVHTLRALQGTMSTFKAEEGLLLSWSGFNRAVLKEARLSFFSVRLWDADELIRAIERNYDRLPDEMQALLPLKRIWALVPDDKE